MDIKATFNLLEEYKKIPQKKVEITFLEMSKYPYRRFEEICSRILSFYFNPKKEHDFKDLFIKSLFELLNKEHIKYQDNQVIVITEENAEGKRIDLVVYTPDFIIGIENKITAQLYNPLDKYKKRLEEYDKEVTIKLVLSLNKITKLNELNLVCENDFTVITYSEFFEIIKRNIGQYIPYCNHKYLLHLYDFIQTLENMKFLQPTEKELADFFFDNSTNIRELIDSFNAHNERVLNRQRERISELKECISNKTGRDWWAWQGWDLGFNSFSQEMPTIGIESSYKETKENALGEFRIYITTWNLRDWVPYERILTEKFPNNFLDKTEGRVYMHMDVIKGDDENLIISKLNEYFELLCDIIRLKELQG